MPCRSPQTVSVAQPATYLSMSQQQQQHQAQHTTQTHQSQLGSINGRVSVVNAAQQINNSQQSSQQQVSAVAQPPPLPLQLATQ